MTKRDAGVAYTQSLVWVASAMAVAVCTTNITELIFVDFIHGDHHRSQENALDMMALFTPILGVAAMIGSFLVFTVPQYVQALLARAFIGRFGSPASFLTLPALPITAILTFYCFDYLTPSNFTLGIDAGPDWMPYQHGLMWHRYLIALSCQTPVTLFSILYCVLGGRPSYRKLAVSTALALAVVCGVLFGHRTALAQYRFL